MENYPPLAHIRPPQEMITRGDPSFRPARGHCLISRTPGMAALEADFTGRTLLATVQGARPPISPEAMVQAMERTCGVLRERVRVEVTFPHDFFISFASTEDCSTVLNLSGHFRCGGATIGFRRWHRSAQATGAKLESFSKLSVEGLPHEAWEWGAVSQLVNNLGGQLVEILPSKDRWCMMLTAWLRDPSSVPMELDFEVPEPEGLPDSPCCPEDPASSAPPPPRAPQFKRTLIHPLIIHVVETVNRSHLCVDTRLRNNSGEDENTTRRHEYACWGGRVDGTGRGPARGGGHAFAGPAKDGIGGGWGRARHRGLFAPAGGMPVPMPATSSAASGSCPLLAPASREPQSRASTATGSFAQVSTPPSPSPRLRPQVQQLRPSPTSISTAVASAAEVPTPSSSPLRQRLRELLRHPSPRSARPSPPLASPPAARSAPSSHHSGGMGPTTGSNGQFRRQGSLERSTMEAKSPAATGIFARQLEQAASPELATVGLLANGSSPPATGQVSRGGRVPLPRIEKENRARCNASPPTEPRPTSCAFGPPTVHEYISQGLCTSPPRSILGPRPAASAPVRRKKKTLPPGFTPRRSDRLRNKDNGINKGPYHKAQTVLIRRLGLATEDEEASPEVLDQYLKLFTKPLAPQHLRAIAALFAPEEVDFDEPAYDGFQAFSLPEEVEPCA